MQAIIKKIQRGLSPPGGNRTKGERGEHGVTYIEILITVVIILVCFVPLSKLFTTSIMAVSMTSDLSTAVNLGREEMEKIKNLNLTETQLADRGSRFYPSIEEPPLTLNSQDWRIKRVIIQDSDPLEVRVYVFNAGNMEKPVALLVTLMEDLR